MIGLLAKNSRAKPLFRLLCAQPSKFVDMGVARPSFAAKAFAFLSSIHPTDFGRSRLDAQFSPFQCDSLQRSCEQHIAHAGKDLTGVLYWGATNQPTRTLKYFIISDGPFDPEDTSYPPEWVPRRWAKDYFARQRKVYREAAHIFTLSDWAAKKIVKVHEVPSDRVTVIGWGPMHDSSGPTLNPTNANHFVSVGSQWKRKGMDILARAGEQLHQSNPGCSVVLVGDPGGFNVEPRPGVVTIAEAVSGKRAQELIGNARALLVGSRFDASPHVIMEAFQAGTPVIASRVCGIPEVVTPETGYLVDAGDAEGFAQAMRACLEQDPVTQRTRVVEHYNTVFGGWERSAGIISRKIEETMGLSQ